MKTEKTDFIKCECCSTEISSETCELAAYFTVIDGKKITFCCKTCAKEFEQEKTETK